MHTLLDLSTTIFTGHSQPVRKHNILMRLFLCPCILWVDNDTWIEYTIIMIGNQINYQLIVPGAGYLPICRLVSAHAGRGLYNRRAEEEKEVDMNKLFTSKTLGRDYADDVMCDRCHRYDTVQLIGTGAKYKCYMCECGKKMLRHNKL